jgi:hypothetical protein
MHKNNAYHAGHGGSWWYTPSEARASSWYAFDLAFRSDGFGLRPSRRCT